MTAAERFAELDVRVDWVELQIENFECERADLLADVAELQRMLVAVMKIIGVDDAAGGGE